MPDAPRTARLLGTMVAYGFPRLDVRSELDLAVRLGAQVLEILPDWRTLPDPDVLRMVVAEFGLKVWSAHGCWGGRTIRSSRVDLGDPDPAQHRRGVDDLRLCVDWLERAGGVCLVVHPGGLSEPGDVSQRREALRQGLVELADHSRGTGIVVCVENMPSGVHPGSRTADLAEIVAEIGRPEIALALDTGHANITATAARETLAAGRSLRTTHVHDNDGLQDSHDPPGLGTINWDDWVESLDFIEYDGPIMLECIRRLRNDPGMIDEVFLARLSRLTKRKGDPM